MKNPLSSSYLTYSKTIKLGFNKVSFRIQIQQTKPNMLTWFVDLKCIGSGKLNPNECIKLALQGSKLFARLLCIVYLLIGYTLLLCFHILSLTNIGCMQYINA